MTVFPNTSADAALARIDASLREHFGPKVDRIDRAAERVTQQQASLLRPDGTPKYAPAEHEERTKGLLAEFDSVGADVTADAEEAIRETEQEIARIDGADPIDTLKPDELARAASLAVFVDLDVDRLLPEQLVKRARAVLAAPTALRRSCGSVPSTAGRQHAAAPAARRTRPRSSWSRSAASWKRASATQRPGTSGAPWSSASRAPRC